MATAYEQSLSLTVEEVGELSSRDGNPEETLANIVVLIANRFEVDVCSVYLLEPDRNHLMLAATVGLRQECVGRLRMSLKEGLAGFVAEQLRPIAIDEAADHPRFKYFKETGEDSYHSFLGVPLIDQGTLQGVLVVQTIDPRAFTQPEVDRLVDAAARLGPIVSEARTLEHFIAPSQERLWKVARNLWWSWNPDVVDLFREIDPVRWRQLDHNPVSMLAEKSLKDIEQQAGQLVLHSRINHAYNRLGEYLEAANTWSATHAGVLKSRPVAYFSAEFGLHESVPIYSGGLGVLAGDHVKSASDLGVPLVGIGLFYDQGYFRQRLDMERWQQEEYMDLNVSQLPLQPAIGAGGEPVCVQIETRTGVIQAAVWELTAGRVRLLLLDSDVEGNLAEDRELTARLYGGDTRVRIRQELLLGVGGVRAMKAMGITPGVLHLNEGHSAFAGLELVRQRMHSEGLDFQTASHEVARQSCFTTHTPVPAGHDRFDADLIEEHLGPLRDGLGISPEHLLSLGRVEPNNDSELFCMTVLALKLSRKANAVSSLHGRVSRQMWSSLWPHQEEEKVPIGHITNGVHVLSWLAPQMHQLYDRHLGVDWVKRSGEPEVWRGVEKINDGELWEMHLTLKSRLIDFVRRRAARDARRRGESQDQIESLRRILIPDALTIGFARRFATYKRANLFLRDLDRLVALITDAQRPVQFVFAGKAHPRDVPGKTVLQEVAALSRDPSLFGKIVFVEDYDMNVGRHLVQGVDVWLNNPRRPLEASGTSGQKVVLNGGLNLSVLDGWWAEAYDGANGFSIGTGGSHVDDEIQDQRDGESLFLTLRDEVIPMYYGRDSRGLPRAWIARMKHAIRTLGWRFNADRMVMDYVKHCYVPAAGGTSSEMGC
ncbi:MAG: alpha-glucan family phosphorylase [Pirellulaceae bacterium]